MKNIYTANISGVEEYLPQEQKVFDKYKKTIQDAYENCGFVKIETPIIYRTEVLLAKAGGDTEKQIFKVSKTDEADAGAKQALRFDNTVPLARYVVKNQDKLKFPFRVAQIARNFRGERAQSGRSREFYQCDIDIIARNRLPIACDADIILTLADTLYKLNLPYSLVLRISNRKILTGFLEMLDITGGTAKKIAMIIDRYEKSGPDEMTRDSKTKSALSELGITGEKNDRILDFIKVKGEPRSIENELRRFDYQKNATFKDGVQELEQVLRIVQEYGLGDSITVKADMKIVRGLDYYTGTVFETMFDVPEEDARKTELGSISICSGGRYDNLAECYGNQKFPGVGGSIGLTRLFAVLKDQICNYDEKLERSVDLAVVPFDDQERLVAYAMSIAKAYRNAGVSAEVIFSGKDFYERKDYAKSVAQKFVFIGENELNGGVLNIQSSDTSKEVERKRFESGKLLDVF